MRIHLRQIPAEGLHIEGEDDCALSQLDSAEARCAGPLRYSLDLGVSDGALWANGEIVQPVELRCVRCLEAFPYDVRVPDFALHLPLAGPEEIDLTPMIREDILLNLPAYPHCDREGDRVCPGAGFSQPSEAEEKRRSDWSELDKLDL